MFVFYKGNMSKNWIGSINSNKSVNLNMLLEPGTKITAKVLMPEKVKEKLEKDGISLALKDEI
jgi:hypothetical protein